MKKIIYPIIIILLGIAAWFLFIKNKTTQPIEKLDPKDSLLATKKVEKIEVKELSITFTNKLDSALSIYDSIISKLVVADINGSKQQTINFKNAISKIDFKELNVNDKMIQDVAKNNLNQIKENANNISKLGDITTIRKEFNNLNQNLFPLLKGILKYKGNKKYWVNCGMPFEEGSSADWLSSKQEFTNPYLGTNHPKYKGTMLQCGTINDSIGE